MEIGELTEYVDVAQVTLYVFWVFFAGLVIHLQRESRREGFPLEDDNGKADGASWLMTPSPKTFHLPHGHGDVSVPNENQSEPFDTSLKKLADFDGAALVPSGDNPLGGNYGSGSYTQRANTPDITFEGDVKLRPMRVATDFSIAKGDIDPRGLRVVGCDEVIAGRISDVWVDKAEQVIRYLEVKLEVGDQDRSVLVPMNFCVIKTPRDREKVFYVHALKGEQFAGVPATKKATEVTFLEEDMIMAYFGSGLRYATPRRSESVI